jgi:hypothetical protein
VGLGHFLTRADLAKLENGPSTSSILQSFSGVGFVRGRGGRSWLTSPHGTHMIAPGSPDAVRACYAQVYLDNLEIYTGRDGEPNFDVNSIPPAEIEAIEYYASPAQTPARYSGLNSTCGVLVIWTLRYHQKDTTSASRRPPAR